MIGNQYWQYELLNAAEKRVCADVWMFLCVHIVFRNQTFVHYAVTTLCHIMPHYDTLWPTYTVTTCWETHSPAVDSWAGWRYRGAHPCVTPDVPSAPPLPSPTPPTPCLHRNPSLLILPLWFPPFTVFQRATFIKYVLARSCHWWHVGLWQVTWNWVM